MLGTDSRPLLTGRLRPGHRVAFDVVAAVVLVFVAAGNLAAGTWSAGIGLPLWVNWIGALGIGVPVLLRRLAPVPTLVASMVLSVVCALGGGMWVAHFAVALPLHAIASLRPRGISVPALGAALVFTSAVNLVPPLLSPDALGGTVLGWTLCCAAWSIGRSGRERQVYATLAAEQRAREAVVDERLRIARELHDVVAHSLSLIAVKSGVAHHVAAQRPDEARTALGVIETTTRRALTEMRTILGVLRSGTDAELAPSPGLAGLPALAEHAQLSGVRVDLDVAVDRALPTGVELAVYRIAQEALTNVVKHAAARHCWIRVTSDAESVTVEVTDDGHGPGTAREGHGLRGMRERVGAHGGTFTAGPRPSGGFAVTAVLPDG